MLYHRVNSSIHDDHDNNKDNDNDHDQICEIVFHLDCFCCMSCLQVMKLKWQCLLKPSYLGSQGHKFNDMLVSIPILCAGVPLLQSKSGPVLPLLNCSTILHAACLPSNYCYLPSCCNRSFSLRCLTISENPKRFCLAHYKWTAISFVILRLKTGLWLV